MWPMGQGAAQPHEITMYIKGNISINFMTAVIMTVTQNFSFKWIVVLVVT